MATKKKASKQEEGYGSPPKTLEHFYGLRLDEEQVVLRDSIWNPDIDIITQVTSPLRDRLPH